MYPYGLFFLLSLLASLALVYPVRQHRLFCLIITVFFMVGALGLYSMVGNPKIIDALDSREARMASARAIITSETAQIRKEPKDLESWIRLGQAFAQNEDWQEAVGAFKQAVVISNGQPEIIMAYAKSLIMAANGTVSDHAKESLRMVLLQNPEHAEARYYMAVRTLQDGKTSEAMQQMKTLYHSLSDDSPVKAMINAQIGKN